MTDHSEVRRDAQRLSSRLTYEPTYAEIEEVVALLLRVPALLAELEQAEQREAALVEVYDAAEALIERTITDMDEVARREVRLSQLLRQHRPVRAALAAHEQAKR